mgnify:FL=1|jgi:hypothetical protein|tara:strand:- start:75 stop:437 length:363 start_codon:yes stop_codon:yes gene_type:complete
MSNIPKQNNDSNQPVKEFFNEYFNETIAFPSNDVDAVVGYFESRGFDRTASISTATVILQQAKIDGVKVFELIDTLQGMDKVQLSYIVTEILNHNRSNTSSLGYKVKTENSLSEKRNIVV